MKRLPLFIILIPMLIGCIVIGCDNHRLVLVSQVDQLLASQDSEWIESSKGDGKFYYKIPNGSIRVKSDGSIDLITVLDGSNFSKLIVSSADGTRAAKVAKRFGINKLSQASIDNSYAIQEELIKDAIAAVSNSMKSSVVFESTDLVKESK